MTRKTSRVSLKYDYLGMDAASLRRALANHLIYSVGKDLYTATDRDLFHMLAYTIRDRLIERWMETMRSHYRQDTKRVYYLSLEFLIGRVLTNSLLNMGLKDECERALEDLEMDLDVIRGQEPDAALGNGGLGRLAACFLDSMATLRLPGYGFGIRYDYGMFNQRIENNRQVEHPENWLRYGNPWEFSRPEVLFPVKFHGRVRTYTDSKGAMRFEWLDADEVMAMAYDTPIPGYATNTVNNLRLWSAKSTRDFNLNYFNEGNYIEAVAQKNESENLSRVLYPDDSTYSGRELRLAQEYFFVSASLQDILRRFTKYHDSVTQLPEKVAIQLNDTHPTVAIVELMRILLDDYELPWNAAWDLTVRTFGYTNHTLLPEALETWSVSLFANLLPRHLQLIREINRRLLDDVRRRFPGDKGLWRRIAIITEEGNPRIRMAHLAIVGSHTVNGVSSIHTQLLRTTIFADFDRLFPGRIINITNGITPRRWLHQANPDLSGLISSRIGAGWIADLDRLEDLAGLSRDVGFQDTFMAIKRDNKEHLARLIKQHLDITVSVHSMFDIQVKRIHEYKRQLLNVLHVITRYNQLRDNPNTDVVPRTIIFGGKAAPAYTMAKLIIELINCVADTVNRDPLVGDRLKVVFVPNYDVTTAGDIIPAAELSEQISAAGTEASGTGNMKLALNGALTIGTLDGANIEIREAVGEENIFIFGLTADGAAQMLREGYDPWKLYRSNEELRRALDMIGSGAFCPRNRDRFRPIFDALTRDGDRFWVLADYAAYLDCHAQVDAIYQQPREWTHRAIQNVAHMGGFSSDRAVREYAAKIWGVGPIHHE